MSVENINIQIVASLPLCRGSAQTSITPRGSRPECRTYHLRLPHGQWAYLMALPWLHFAQTSYYLFSGGSDDSSHTYLYRKAQACSHLSRQHGECCMVCRHVARFLIVCVPLVSALTLFPRCFRSNFFASLLNSRHYTPKIIMPPGTLSSTSTIADPTATNLTPGEPQKPWDISLIGGLLAAFLSVALLAVIFFILYRTRKRTPPCIGGGVAGPSLTPGMRSEKSLGSVTLSRPPSVVGPPRVLTRDPSSGGVSVRSGFPVSASPRITRVATGLGPGELVEEDDEDDEKADIDASYSITENSTSGSNTRVNTRFSSRSNIKTSPSSRSASRSASTSTSSASIGFPASLPRLHTRAEQTV